MRLLPIVLLFAFLSLFIVPSSVSARSVHVGVSVSTGGHSRSRAVSHRRPSYVPLYPSASVPLSDSPASIASSIDSEAAEQPQTQPQPQSDAPAEPEPQTESPAPTDKPAGQESEGELDSALFPGLGVFAKPAVGASNVGNYRGLKNSIGIGGKFLRLLDGERQRLGQAAENLRLDKEEQAAAQGRQQRVQYEAQEKQRKAEEERKLQAEAIAAAQAAREAARQKAMGEAARRQAEAAAVLQQIQNTPVPQVPTAPAPAPEAPAPEQPADAGAGSDVAQGR